MQDDGNTPRPDATVRAILLDVDGTLYDQASLRRAMLVRLLRFALRSPLRGLRALRVIGAYRRAQEDLRDQIATAPSSVMAATQCLLAAERAGVSADEVGEIVARWMDHEPLPLLAARRRPGLSAFLAQAADRGVPVAVVSDYPAEAKLEHLGIRQWVQVVVCAQDAAVGRFKPNPRGLVVACRVLGIDPARAVYVGDRASVDAAAAEAAGIPCYIFSGSAAGPGQQWTAVGDFPELQRLIFP